MYRLGEIDTYMDSLDFNINRIGEHEIKDMHENIKRIFFKFLFKCGFNGSYEDLL